MSIEERLIQLETQVQQYAEFEAIRRLLATYCQAIDNKDTNLLNSLFSRHMKLSINPWSLEFSGREAAVDFFAKAFLDTQFTRNNYSNEVIEVDEDGYRSSCNYHSEVAIDSRSFVGWGTNNDKFGLEDGQLKFTEKVITVLVLTPCDEGWAGPEAIVQVHK